MVKSKLELSDEQVLDFIEKVHALRKRGFLNQQIANVAGYSSRNAIVDVLGMRIRPGRKAYTRLLTFMANGAATPASVPRKRAESKTAAATQPTAAPAPPVPPAPSVQSAAPAKLELPAPTNGTHGVLHSLECISKHLREAQSACAHAQETCVPLLKPGLRELSGKLAEIRRWLEVA